MKRSELRENIFKIIFGVEFNPLEELNEKITLYIDQMDEVSEKDAIYITEKVQKVAEKLEEIDALINEAADGWKTTRMGKVDLSILRLAVYEMNFDDDVPVKVAINEAVNLAKEFSGDESPAFINGVLGKIIEK